MRTKIIGLFCGVVAASALTGPAAAGEQLVMPFACHVAGGQVQLVPSEPRAYQIYGQRAQRSLTTCSPYDPRRCHTWSVHRFDLDCGGIRTSWPSVVAALSPILADSVGYGRPGGPPPRLAPPHRPSPGASAFPGGFAPNPMRVARFERSDLAPVNVPLPPKKPAPAEPIEVAEMAPSVEPAAETPAETTPAETAPAKTAPAETPPAEDNDTDKTTALAQQRALQIETESASSEVTGALPKPKASSLLRDAGLVFVLTVAALLALSAALLMRQRGLALLPARTPLRLRGPTNLLPVLRRGAVAEHESPPARGQHKTIEAPAVRLRLWDKDWLPKTRAEALNVLGVDPLARRDKIKSTVTRLRRALHPDYAFDDEDRDLRERRLKQINVAWEIVSAKRRAPWLAAKPQGS